MRRATRRAPGRWRVRPGAVHLAATLTLTAGSATGCVTGRGLPTVRPARDPQLRAVPLALYPAPGSAASPRAVVFFFGNDRGVAAAHQRLAAELARSGYAVAALDMRPVLAALPEGRPARDSAFARQVGTLVARSRAELGGQVAPLVIAGHSLGAEMALWTAAYVRPPGLVGVLAMSPGGRSHLRITEDDLQLRDPTGPESFSVPDAVAAVTRTGARVAVVRGSGDPLRAADAALLAAGGGGVGVRRFRVPFAGHGLNQLTFVRRVVRQALDWIAQAHPVPGLPGVAGA